MQMLSLGKSITFTEAEQQRFGSKRSHWRQLCLFTTAHDRLHKFNQATVENISNHIVIWFIATRRHNIISDQSGWDVSRKTNASESHWWKLQQIFVKTAAQGGRKKRNCWTMLLVFFLTVDYRKSFFGKTSRRAAVAQQNVKEDTRRHDYYTSQKPKRHCERNDGPSFQLEGSSGMKLHWHDPIRQEIYREELQCCTHSSVVVLDIGLGLQTTSWGSRSRLRRLYRAWYQSGTGRTGDFDPDQCNNTIITVKNQAADILSSTDNTQSDTLPLIPYLEGIALHTTLLFIKYE